MHLKDYKPTPPKRALAFLRWFCRADLLEDVEGDLNEYFDAKVSLKGVNTAKWLFVLEVLLLFRPGVIRSFNIHAHLNSNLMLKNHFKIAWRQLLKSKGYSIINIGGLAAGMAVSILIGLWIHDEMTFNKYHKNYDRIAQVMMTYFVPDQIGTSHWTPAILGEELSQSYGNNFERVVMSSHPQDHVISIKDLSFSAIGNYMQPGGPEMLTIKMLKGSNTGLTEVNSIMLSQSLAEKLFGEQDPMNKTVKINLKYEVKVIGVYEDLPKNSAFNEMAFIVPWDLLKKTNPWWNKNWDSWDNNIAQVFVQLTDNSDMDIVSEKIKDIVEDYRTENKNVRIVTFLHPMSRWHLHEEFKDGKNIGGKIRFVWLFGIIGMFVLLLACINFMNLSTARAESRTKEVGIRKAIGSFRSQLIHQFFSESLLVVTLAFIVSISMVFTILPWFNEIADKEMGIPWTSPLFWVLCVGFALLTGLIAGSYPAFYLSSFQTVKALKGTFRFGKSASLPRQMLVVLQFTVSVTLIIGTMIVYRQIQHSKDRPLGYSQDGLIYLRVNTSEIHKHFEVIRNKLITSGAIVEMAESAGTVTGYAYGAGDFEWRGKDPNFTWDNILMDEVSPEYGKTVGWNILEGRDFSREIISDKQGLIVNESTVKMMGLEDPVGEIVKWKGNELTIVGVVNNLMVQSPYQTIEPAAYRMSDWAGGIVSLKLNPAQSAQEALEKIRAVFKEYAPGLPFDYKFADQQYAKKFDHEVRIGKLALVFTILAILISCLGLFGLASFMAKKRTKEIGIRKVIGASVFDLWKMMSKEFVMLVIISCLIAMPTAFYFLKNWLENYPYRTSISWWMLTAAGAGALVIALLTVSYQAIKAATANPVNSLRSE